MYKKLCKVCCSGLVLGASLMAQESAPAQNHKLSKIQITEEALPTPTMQMYESVYTGSQVSQKGVELSGEKAKGSVYEALSILPSIQSEGVEAHSLAVEQRDVRLRGVKGSMGALTLDGVPNYGGNPIGPRDYLYDMENIESLSLYKGAIPGDIGTGVGSRGGAITLHPKWAKEKSGFLFTQGIGSRNYKRSYLRADSGALGAFDTRLSAAFSYGKADKWKGEGELGARKNLNLTLAQPLGERGALKLWVNRNTHEQTPYRALSYAQVMDKDVAYSLDFHANRTLTPANDVLYYGYNLGKYKNSDYIAIFDYALSDALKLTLKPYYSREDTNILQGNTSNSRVQKRVRDITKKGAIVGIGGDFGTFKGALGYHYEESEMKVHTENHLPTKDGLSYRGIGVFAAGGVSKLHSPYLKVSTNYKAWSAQAGVKYFRFEDSALAGYTSQNAAPYSLVRASDLDREQKSYSTLLPSLGVAYEASENLKFHASYGKSFMRPYSYIPLMNYYRQNRAAFNAAKIKVQELFDGHALEKSDTVDFGVRFVSENFEIAPTIFYATHKNLLTNISDSRVLVGGKPASYQQNIGKAKSYGVELEMSAFLGDSLTLFINPSYTKFVYSEDLSFKGANIPVKGNQIVDTPKWIVKSGAIYALNGFEIAPSLRYLGARFGDSTQSERINGYLLADLRVSYAKKHFYKDSTLKASLEVSNIFDKRYISQIDVWDDGRSGTASYYAGAPRSVMFNVALEF